MRKIIFGIFGMVIVLMMSLAVAKPDFVEWANPAGRTVELPEYAKPVSPGVYYLGTAVADGEFVEGYAFMETAKENRGKVPSGTSSCYTFLAKSAKWKTVEPWMVDPANNRGLDGNEVFQILTNGAGKWENAAVKDIFGDGSFGAGLTADMVSPDGNNEVYFANIAEPGAIGITIVWGVFSGPTFSRKLVEWDQVYDDVDFDWSTNGELTKMDFDNIATHELGHSAGLGDLYTTACSEATMYGYATEGETKKRTLEAGDTTGIKSLYK